jgi:uncharacterized repeat protein (TIGR03803 family)
MSLKPMWKNERLLGFMLVAGCLATLGACGGNNGIPSTPGALAASAPAAKAQESVERVVYRFKGGADGALPLANLIAVRGKLYGTTQIGGSGNGTVFSIDPSSGLERILYTFKGGSDGAFPVAGLLAAKGALYGTTAAGGSSACDGLGCGTVFVLDASGNERVLYRFKGGSDGATVQSGLIYAGGQLYGTTSGGGNPACSGGCGTIYAIGASGRERILHRFKGPDGAVPRSTPAFVRGTLFGTASNGGVVCYTFPYPTQCGTVFAFDLAAQKERTVHQFAGHTDGEGPIGTLLARNGVLYGTTQFGGPPNGLGTVFEVRASGERVLYDFAGGADGATPYAGPIEANGELYGTTLGNDVSSDQGTVFAVGLSGAGHVLHRFHGGRDGASPSAGLVALNGMLYGTTENGGGSGAGCSDTSGCGTVFAIPLPRSARDAAP